MSWDSCPRCDGSPIPGQNLTPVGWRICERCGGRAEVFDEPDDE